MKDRIPARVHPRRVTSPFLLSGLAHCGHCGKALTGRYAKSGNFSYYVCGTLDKKGAGSCSAKNHNAKKFEGAIIEQIKTRVLTKENLKELVDLTNQALDSDMESHHNELDAISRTMDDTNRRLERLYDAIETGKIDLADLAIRIKELRQRQEQLQTQRIEIENRVSDRRVELVNLEMMTEIWRIRLIKGAAISWFSGIIITSIITQLFARKGLNFTRTRVNLSRVRDMYAYSVRGYMQLVAENLNPVIGIFIIRYMLTTTDVGLFIVANSLLTIMGTPVLSISFVLFPKLSRADESSTLETALKVMKLVFLMLVTCSVILLLIGKPVIILLFGQEFEGSVIPLFYLLPGLISMGVFRILTDHLKSINRPEIGSYASSIGFVINIFLTIILLAPGRLYGASIGYSSSFLAAALLLLLYYRYKLDVPYIDLFLISRKDLRSYRKLAVNMVNFARNRMGR